MQETQEKFVLQCSRCRSIVGDSGSLVKISGASFYVLNQSYNVMLTGTVGRNSALKGLAEGTAQSVICAKCKSSLGAVYTATPPQFDFLRQNWTLDPHRVSKFVVGSPNITLQPNIEVYDTAHEIMSLKADLLLIKQMKFWLTEAVRKVNVLEEQNLLQRLENLENQNTD
eukprot:TRINITY_DN8522_c0_g1_i2.p1 TRINITY_DN8522_c0_g1~~TRINITY_DN8522_c0_g1_i2.p1  ORF type:complete len:170 (-),score=30.56 TRINITY_DN8522_c0_g1_i2:134-643(-)